MIIRSMELTILYENSEKSWLFITFQLVRAFSPLSISYVDCTKGYVQSLDKVSKYYGAWLVQICRIIVSMWKFNPDLKTPCWQNPDKERLVPVPGLLH